jgi:GAF domain-containing protein
MKRIAKTERITILGSPEFKAFLALEAEKSGVSVSELVRTRCEQTPLQGEDAATLEALAGELARAVAEARASLELGLASVQEALAARGEA